MRIVGTIFGLLLALIYVLCAAAAAIVFAIQAQVFNPATYENLFAANDVYAHVQDTIARSYVPPSSLGGLPAEKVNLIANELLPVDALQAAIEPAIGQWVAFLKGERSDLSIDWTLLKVTAGQNGPTALAAAQQGLPACSVDQARSGAAMRFECVPSPDQDGQTQAQSLLDAAIAGAPDTSVINLEREREGFDAEGRRKLHLGMRYGALVPLGIYLLVAVFAVRSWSAALLWFAIPTLFAGLVTGAVGVVSGRLFPDFLRKKMGDGNGLHSDPAGLIVSDLSVQLSGGLSNGIMIAGAGLAMTAVAALLATGAIRKAAAPPGTGYY